jgi:hypothetical protein
MMGITAIGSVFTIIGLLILVISIPLIYGKIPMNRFYGIRIPSAFKSDQDWYQINGYGGRKLASWSWLITGTGVAGLFLPPYYLPAYALIGAGVVLIAAIAPLMQILIWNRTRDRS